MQTGDLNNGVDDSFSDAPGDRAPIPPNNNTPDDFAIAFTTSTLVNNNGDLVQLFGDDTSGNGGAIAKNFCQISDRGVKFLDMGLGSDRN